MFPHPVEADRALLKPPQGILPSVCCAGGQVSHFECLCRAELLAIHPPLQGMHFCLPWIGSMWGRRRQPKSLTLSSVGAVTHRDALCTWRDLLIPLCPTGACVAGVWWALVALIVLAPGIHPLWGPPMSWWGAGALRTPGSGKCFRFSPAPQSSQLFHPGPAIGGSDP